VRTWELYVHLAGTSDVTKRAVIADCVTSMEEMFRKDLMEMAMNLTSPDVVEKAERFEQRARLYARFVETLRQLDLRIAAMERPGIEQAAQSAYRADLAKRAEANQARRAVTCRHGFVAGGCPDPKCPKH
jgi:hypothetical protein